MLLPKNDITGFWNSYHPNLTYFPRRFKICNLILPSLLGNGRINMYLQRFWGFFFSIFSKFKLYDRSGRSQFKISHIPWINIFTAKIFRIILNGKTLLYSGLSWIFWLRSDGAKNSLENNASYFLINNAV